MKFIKQHKKAFTLVEILVTVFLLGILFVVFIAKMDFATDRAKITGVQNDFRSYQTAIEQVAKENAGLAILGWDIGDLNGNHERDSFDAGDTDQDGIMDPGETWTGRKVYIETWHNVFTLKNPADPNDRSAIFVLEREINRNLDPKLHIHIKDDLSIVMARGAEDPWDMEYFGYYISNAEVDHIDRGAIVLYSTGKDQKFGSEHKIENGIAEITVPDDNVDGSDDMGIVIFYTFANGYGEVITETNGFPANQKKNIFQFS